ncbi:hypothetical protein K1719_036521 [Acacia pycnantha]|nr:hypothetical protein K1719_036521 [Acacia pycnantha]
MDSTKSGKIFVILVLLLFTSGSEVVRGQQTVFCTDTKSLSHCTPEKCSDLCEEWYGPSNGDCRSSKKCQCSWPCNK